MISQTPFSVQIELIDTAVDQIKDHDVFTINEPTGDFFYDQWKIKNELQGTIWEKLYNSLPVHNKGEARIIKLEGNESYFSHADIDDRYHLNLSGNKSFLIDLDNLKMHPVSTDGIWYDMDAGTVHTAANFSNRLRYQLVIRKLLTRGKLKDPKNFKLVASKDTDPDDARFIFDDVMSKWFNQTNKKELLDNFMFKNNIISFTLDSSMVEDLMSILPKEFIIV
jgi:hypothetical protein